MRLFKNKELTEEVYDTIDFGIVKAGDSKEFEYFIQNDSLAFIKDLEFSVDNKEVQIIEAPKTLAPSEIKTIKMKWIPSITLKQGLKTEFKINATELWE